MPNREEIFSTYHAMLASQFDPDVYPGMSAPPTMLAKTLDVLNKASGVSTNTYDFKTWAKGDPENYKVIASDIKKAMIDVGILLKLRQSEAYAGKNSTDLAKSSLVEYQKNGLRDFGEQVNFIWERNVGGEFTWLDSPRPVSSVKDLSGFVSFANKSITEYAPPKKEMDRRRVLGAVAGVLFGGYVAEPHVSSWVDNALGRPYKTLGFRNFEHSGNLHPRVQELLHVMESNMQHRGLPTLMLHEMRGKTKTLRPEKTLVTNWILTKERSLFSSKTTYKYPGRPVTMRDPETNSPAEVVEEQESSLHACTILTKEQTDAVRRKLQEMLQEMGKDDPVLQNTIIDPISKADKAELEKYYNIPEMHSILVFKNLEDRKESEINAFLSTNLKPLADVIKAHAPRALDGAPDGRGGRN